ncbi:kinase domain protein [Ancylostoma caninum]|uniref:PRKR-like endoplasmic reticulum kinase n=1 Tax=Ancylostoma caninum TaxID=29170 RepID=A0A368GDQ7_ANCCA|nr:kinase domain protein [Ancylostoma caninum]
MPRSVLFLGGSLVVLGAFLIRSVVVGLEDGVITEEQIEAQQQLDSVPVIPEGSVYDTSQCCRDPELENANYLFISTMDGRLHALDASNEGNVVWVADLDAEALLCGTLGKMQPMQVDGRVFTIVPALDGNLYMYSREEHLLEPIPLSTDVLLQASVRVGHDAVAGGRTISTTGVDPLTGEVRYHCSSSHCDSVASDSVSSTLVFRRSTSKVRAVDALTGTERCVDELLSSSYKRSFTAKQAKNNEKLVPGQKSHELQVVAANEGRTSYPSISCPSSEGTALIGEKDIKSAAFSGPGGGDQGWFIMRPSGKFRKRDALFGLLDPSQCHANIVERFSRTLRVDHMVSGWWRIIALAMVGLLGSASVVMHALLTRRRKRDAFSPAYSSSSESSEIVPQNKTKRAETRSTSVGPSVDSGPSSTTPTPTEQIARQRRTTSSHESVGETFHSKFIQDFEPVKLLGHGGFGVVFEAINRLDECPYAVKRIAVSNSERAIQRVLREVRAMAKLDHPGIIRYYHTWIERPPDGWQEEQDNLMLRGMQSRSSMADLLDEMTSESSEPSSAVPVPVSEISSEPSMDVVAPAMNECSDDGSWLDDDDEGIADPDDSSDSDDPVISTPPKLTREDSESVIFGALSSGDASKANMKVSTEISQLGKKMVLVTSTDEDLMPSVNTNNFVYIYIQMQLCQEQTLHAWLSEHRSWEDRPLDKMKVWMTQMCSAVSYIHQQGLIHRDMKPQNIFFASDQALKVGDLGLVTRCVPAEDQPIEKNATRFAVHTDNVGTRGYMSPEQLANKPYTFKVDVFSLGLIFCELVIPFQTLMERSLTLSSLQHDRVPDVLAGMPAEKEFIRWLTCMDPDKRPTCDEILDSDYLVAIEDQALSNRANGPRRRHKTDSASS